MEKSDYTADDIITDCMENIKALGAKYDCDVMIVETGMECGDDKGNLASASVLAEGKRQLERIVKESREYRRTLQGCVLLGAGVQTEPVSVGSVYCRRPSYGDYGCV